MTCDSQVLRGTAVRRGASASFARMPLTIGLGGHGKSAVAQDGKQLGFLHGGLERQQRLQLRIAVLFDHEDGRVRLQESFDVAVEGKGLDAQIVHVDLLPPENVERLADCAVAAAEADDSDFIAALAHQHGSRQVFRRVRELSLQPVEHDLVFGGIFGVGAILIVARTAREVRALGTGSRQRAVR